jgi:signal transduction histidine kinase
MMRTMRSLRARVFVTTAIVLAVATIAAGLLSRQATLVEERQIVGRPRPANLDGIADGVQRDYLRGGWADVRRTLASGAARSDLRLIAVDRGGRLVAASTPALEAMRVQTASPDGVALLADRDGARANVEVHGGPTFAVRDAAGAEIGRVYAVPGDASGPPSGPMLAPWVRTTLGTAVVAVAVAFLVGGRVLRPVTELTRAVLKMREGDLTVRVSAAGDDEMARLGHAFNEMAARLAQTERTKRQMVSDVAHELRSPLTNLRCGLEAIQDGLASADRTRIDMLHSETLLLQRLAGDLEDLARADAGGLSLRREAVDIASTAARVANGAEDGGPGVSVSIAPDARTVHADPGRLEQMLRNLVSNARRHTPGDGRIEIRSRRDGGMVAIAVSDTGCGIASDHLPYVFDRFYRVDASRTRATGGAGLGLAIVRGLAEAQGGSVSVESGGEGRGATFTIRLPT